MPSERISKEGDTVPIPEPTAERTAPRQLIRDRAYSAIKSAILDGTLLPGERLDDAELQQWLEVSRTPIRQALYALTLEGLVETAPQSHTRVVSPRIEHARENLQTIGVLMVGVLDLTIPTLTTDDRERLAELAEAVVPALRRHDLEASIAAAGPYYRALTRLCPNRTLVRLVDQARTSLGYFVMVAFQSMEMDWRSLEAQHLDLVAALRHGTLTDLQSATKRLFRIGGGR
jgi:DNA-binding GntR family transcriptional regulator